MDSRHSAADSNCDWNGRLFPSITVNPEVGPAYYYLIFDVQFSNSKYSFSQSFNVYWQESAMFVKLSLSSGGIFPLPDEIADFSLLLQMIV
jgi:hypothetical protein